MGRSAQLVLVGGSFLMAISMLATCAAGVIGIVDGPMHPAPSHYVSKVHEVGDTRSRLLAGHWHEELAAVGCWHEELAVGQCW